MPSVDIATASKQSFTLFKPEYIQPAKLGELRLGYPTFQFAMVTLNSEFFKNYE